MSQFLQILVTAYIVIYSQGAKCPDSHHCSECDEQTGRCKTKCHRGYFGPTCQDVCYRRCRYHTCELVPDKGIGRCTDGCIPGFQGLTCQRPCDTHHTGCTRCPGGCDGEYCQVSGACFSGCRDSYYGAGCKTCSSRCKSCNRITGTCEECHPPYSGVECGHSCKNCVGGCESGCKQECRHGFYGDDCTKACSATCRPNPSLSTDGQCPDRESCPPECHSQSGECVHGCVDGWYGPKCSRRCSSNCQHQRCNQTGACVVECGKCLGEACNRSCITGCDGCAGGFCDLTSGVCVQICNSTGFGCGVNCTDNCRTPDCPSGLCEPGEPVAGASSAVMVTSVVVVVFIILAACTAGCYICYRKGMCPTRKNVDDQKVEAKLEQADIAIHDYLELHHYEDIREDDIVEPDQNQPGKETLAIPVVADCFPGEVKIGVKDRPGTDSYTELKKGGRVSRPRSSVGYISPLD
ncbi:scavenger receptor class F member 1-like [Haliotis asinina]|uniref:scavenger receptor class F member 1-like n=1 Tax=Haliotis asinina TaxID=109174 RepID=UPI003531DD95